MIPAAVSASRTCTPAGRFARAALLLSAIVTASACSSLHFPGVHRIVVQQGNVITPVMIEKLKPGMSRNQVRFVMGNAVIEHPFNQRRWDYVYTVDIRGQELIERRLSLYFDEEGKLTHYEGNYLPEEKVAATE